MDSNQPSSGVVAVKVLAGQLEQNWVLHQGRRAMYLGLELLLYVAAITFLLIDVFVMSKGHKLLVAEAQEGPMRAGTYVEDDRVTAVLMLGYLLLFVLAVGSFIMARLIRSSRKRRSQVQKLCAAVRAL